MGKTKQKTTTGNHMLEQPEPWPDPPEKSAGAKTIRVRVKQAHEIANPGGGFRRLPVGHEIEILEEDFCDNLHEKIP